MAHVTVVLRWVLLAGAAIGAVCVALWAGLDTVQDGGLLPDHEVANEEDVDAVSKEDTNRIAWRTDDWFLETVQ